MIIDLILLKLPKMIICIVGRLFGYVDVKSSVGVHFYVERRIESLKQTPNAGVIRFNKAFLNTGNAMNMTSGIFTAPVNGTYHFHFTGHREIYDISKVGSSWLTVELRLNDQAVAYSFTATVTLKISCQSVLKLKAGDRVYVYKNQGWFSVGPRTTQFTGYLLEEDLKF